LKEEAKSRMLSVLPYIRYAVEQAKKEGDPKLGILAVEPGGAGQVIARFGVEFLEDVALLLDAPPQTEEDNRNAIAQEFLDTLGLNHADR
jgi:hypothetical protein